MHSVVQDVRYAFRMLAKDPVSSALAVLALALGIGLVTTQFSVINGMLFRGLPFEGSDSLYSVTWNYRNGQAQSDGPRIHDFYDLREQQTSFEGLAAFYTDEVVATHEGSWLRYSACFISANFLDLLHVQPILGRGFLEGEDRLGAEPVALLGYDAWQRDFQGAADAIGESILIRGEAYSVVGVLPQDFEFPAYQQLWTPMQSNHLALEREIGWRASVFGRLKDGVSPNDAKSEFALIAERLKRDFPESSEGYGSLNIKLYHDIVGDSGKIVLSLMFVAVIAVLAIACANVANILLGRAALRGRELAIRGALGASRRRVTVQMLTESLALSTLGAVGGIFLAIWGVELAWHFLDTYDLPFWISFDLDIRCLSFVIGATLLTGLFSGLAPALRSSRIDVNEMLKDNPRTASSLHLGRFSKALVVAQMSLSYALLLMTTMMIVAVFMLFRMDLPFDPSTVLATSLHLDEDDYPDEGDAYAFSTQLAENLGNVPGIDAVAVTSRYQMNATLTDRVEIDGRTYPTQDDYPAARWEMVSNGYFTAVDVAVLQGREFLNTDTADSMPVALVNSVFAERYWPGESPLGMRFRTVSEEKDPWLIVVGVVPDLSMQGSDNALAEPGFYLPLSQNREGIAQNWATILLRGRGEMASWIPIIHREVIDLSPEQSMGVVMTLDEAIKNSRSDDLFILGSFVVFGLVALFLASVGVYGVVSFSVNQRTQEIGVRMALGARSRDILWMVMKQGIAQLAVGLTLGVGLGYGFLRLIDSTTLGDIPYHDPRFYLAVSAFLSAAALLATWRPALRASRLYPTIALQGE